MLARSARRVLAPATLRALRPAPAVGGLVAAKTRAQATAARRFAPYVFENVTSPGDDPTMLMEWLADESGYAGPVGITVKWFVATEDVKLVKEIFAEITPNAKKAPGCMQYDLIEDFTPEAYGPDVSVFFLLERWEKKKDFHRHLTQPYATKFFGRMAELKKPPVTKFAMYRFVIQNPV